MDLAGNAFVIGRPDSPLESVASVGAQTNTNWDIDLYTLGYGYSCVNQQKMTATLGAGINLRHLDYRIRLPSRY